MGKRNIGCKKCRQIGEKVCTKVARCALERRQTYPGQHGRKIGTKKLSEYGKQLLEKQKVKYIYGVAEKQFRRFFESASKKKGVTGENLLSLLESRLDNVLYRLKMAVSREQARQMVVHGHILVNGKRIKSPSYIANTGDKISLSERTLKKEEFMKGTIDKRININIKVPEWLELKKQDYTGAVLREPVREDIKAPIAEHLIVELYSK